MSRVIVIEFVSLDGVMHDPDGSDGSPQGGWAFRYGPEAIAGDKFGLGEVLDTGALLLGRRTWQLFAKIWPGRDDPFSAKMNAMPKLVVSRSLEQAAEWQNSTVLQGNLVAEIRKRKQAQDIVVTGSASVVHALTAHDLADEYRLLVFPLVLGAGTRLFPDGTAPRANGSLVIGLGPYRNAHPPWLNPSFPSGSWTTPSRDMNSMTMTRFITVLLRWFLPCRRAGTRIGDRRRYRFTRRAVRALLPNGSRRDPAGGMQGCGRVAATAHRPRTAPIRPRSAASVRRCGRTSSGGVSSSRAPAGR